VPGESSNEEQLRVAQARLLMTYYASHRLQTGAGKVSNSMSSGCEVSASTFQELMLLAQLAR